MSPVRILLVLVAGLLFGSGLAVSGMTNPERVVGFLEVTGDWDPTLAFVMGGALAVFGAGAWLLRSRLPRAESERVSVSLLLGSALFGVGWGLSGFCPGPALANLACLREAALWFLPAMLVGMLLAQRLAGTDG